MENNKLNMYLLLKIVIFPCHRSFRRCKKTIVEDSPLILGLNAHLFARRPGHSRHSIAIHGAQWHWCLAKRNIC